MSKQYRLNQFLRCVVSYREFGHTRLLHFAVSCDKVSSFIQMCKDTFVSPDINFSDIIYSYENRDYYKLI